MLINTFTKGVPIENSCNEDSGCTTRVELLSRDQEAVFESCWMLGFFSLLSNKKAIFKKHQKPKKIVLSHWTIVHYVPSLLGFKDWNA